MRDFAWGLLSTTAAAALIAALPEPASAQAAPEQSRGAQTFNYDIPAQPLDAALRAFARASRQQILFDRELVRGKRSLAVVGSFSAEEAVARLLEGSGLHARRTKAGSWVVASTEGNGPGDDSDAEIAAGRGASSWGEDVVPEGQEGIAEILVVGSRSQNVDIRRSEDGVLPYVVIDADEIRRSGVNSVEDFFRTQVPMDTANVSNSQVTGDTNVQGAINLRGVGANQTLILVDGRRIAGTATNAFGLQQPNISGVPLSAIERIELLPSTAGAIYGGGATGGVINIIRKRYYSGLDLQASYGNSFLGDVDTYEVSLSGGTTLSSGRTQLSFTANFFTNPDPLTEDERSFASRSRLRRVDNLATALTSASPPPSGTTPNICAAQQFTPTFVRCISSPLVLDNGQDLSSSFTHVPLGYGGPSTDMGAALLANAGSYNLAIPANGQFLSKAPERFAVAADIRHELASSLSLYANASGDLSIEKFNSKNGGVISNLFLPANAPENPFQQSVLVNVSVPGLRTPGEIKSRRLSLVGGAILRLPHRWAATLEHNWNQARHSGRLTSGDLMSAEGLNLLRSVAFQGISPLSDDFREYFLPSPNVFEHPRSTVLNATSLRASGPTFRLPAGPLTITALAERRVEEVGESLREDKSTDLIRFGRPAAAYFPPRYQRVSSLYVEGLAPVLSEQQAIPLVSLLELQASIRHDRYTTTSTTNFFESSSPQGPFPEPDYAVNKFASTSYLLGLRYSPISDLVLRGSYSIGFLPPNLHQVVPETTAVTTTPVFGTLLDPHRGGTIVSAPYTVAGGGNPDLKAERSRSWAAGLIFKPRIMAGLRLAVDYTDIRKSGEIFGAGSQFILDNEDSFPGRIARGPNLPGDPTDWRGPISFIDATLLNVLHAKIRAIDFQADYDLSLEDLGDFRFSAQATRQLKLTRKYAVSTDAYDNVDYFGGPLKWKGSASLLWQKNNWTAGWSSQYFHLYHIIHPPGSGIAPLLNPGIIARQGDDRIPSQLYHDIFVAYRFGSSSYRVLRGSEVSLGVMNIFDAKPPVIVTANLDQLSRSTYSTYGDPRLRRFQLTIRKSIGM